MRLCRELDLYGRESIAVDGTRIEAVNNRDRNFTRAKLKRGLQRIDDRLEGYLEQMNETDANEASGGGNSVADLQDKIATIRKRKETLEGHRQKLDETGKPSCRLRIRTPSQCTPGQGSEWATTSRSRSTASTT